MYMGDSDSTSSAGAGVQSTPTVSPVTQIKVSPQISPLFQPIIDSAGARAYGSVSNIAPGGQSASTKGADAGGFGMGPGTMPTTSAPSSPGFAPPQDLGFDSTSFGYNPFKSEQILQRDFDINKYAQPSGFPEIIRADKSINWQPIIYGVLALVAIGGAFVIYNNRAAKA